MPSSGAGGSPSAHPAQLAALVGLVGLCLLAGAVDSGIAAGPLHGWYLSLRPPAGAPAAWVFAPAWVAVDGLAGAAAWLVWRVPEAASRRPLLLWGWQLLLGAAWAPAFFGLRSPALAAAVMLPLLALIGLTIGRFAAIHRLAAALLLPYAVWTCYIAYLDLGLL